MVGLLVQFEKVSVLLVHQLFQKGKMLINTEQTESIVHGET